MLSSSLAFLEHIQTGDSFLIKDLPEEFNGTKRIMGYSPNVTKLSCRADTCTGITKKNGEYVTRSGEIIMDTVKLSVYNRVPTSTNIVRKKYYLNVQFLHGWVTVTGKYFHTPTDKTNSSSKRTREELSSEVSSDEVMPVATTTRAVINNFIIPSNGKGKSQPRATIVPARLRNNFTIPRIQYNIVPAVNNASIYDNVGSISLNISEIPEDELQPPRKKLANRNGIDVEKRFAFMYKQIMLDVQKHINTALDDLSSNL